MPRFGLASRDKLDTCKTGLRMLFASVVKTFDCTVMEGRRTPERQVELYDKGATKTLDSKHIPLDNKGEYDPKGWSKAADVVPYPIRWPKEEVMQSVLKKINEDAELKRYIKDLARFYAFGGCVKGIASMMGLKIRWGGDWDGDWDFTDQTFDDLVHFEEE